MGKESRIDEYRRCAAAGMGLMETARRLGVNRCSLSAIARRNGIEFVNKRDEVSRARMNARWEDPEFRRQRSASLRAKWCDPEFRAAMVDAVSKPRAIAGLTDAEREDYVLLTRQHGYRRDEALHAIGRADLVEATE